MTTLALRGPINEPNSYGGNLRSLAVACHKAGVPVATIDCPSGLWRNHILALEKEESEILEQLKYTPVAPGNYALVHHVVPGQFVYDPQALVNIGYTLFETDGIPNEWLVPLQAMDEVWCATTFNMSTFRGGGVRKPIRLVPHGVNTDWFKPGKAEKFPLGLNESDVVFGMCFDWTPRKNGINTIAAFMQALAGIENAVLVLKVYFKSPGMIEQLRETIKQMRQAFGAEKAPRILISTDIIPDCEMPNFYQQIDYLISCTHGEGFNKPVLEAMACGVPSIVTGWSGHMDFCNSDNSIWISDTPLGGVQPEQVKECGGWYHNQRWAFPSIGSMIESIRWAYETKDTPLIQNMRQLCVNRAQDFSWTRVAEHIKEILNANSPKK